MQNMSKKHKFNSNYKYNPLDPRNWTLFCKVVVISSILLIIDWILGLNIQIESIELSFFAENFTDTDFFIKIFPLVALIIILVLIPFLNKDMDESPFFGAIIIKVILYLGSCQYTILGKIGEFILSLSCSILIVVVLVFIILIETEEPINKIQVLIFGLILLIVHLIINIFIFSWRFEETWGLIFILTILAGILLIQRNLSLIGGLLIFIITIIIDYIIAYDLNGLDAGLELLKFASLFIVISSVGSR